MKAVENVESLLLSVLHWLESGDEDKKWWQLQTQVAHLCLLELDLITKAEAGRPGGMELSPSPIASIRNMVDAMDNRNRTEALDFGHLALAQLSIRG